MKKIKLNAIAVENTSPIFQRYALSPLPIVLLYPCLS